MVNPSSCRDCCVIHPVGKSERWMERHDDKWRSSKQRHKESWWIQLPCIQMKGQQHTHCLLQLLHGAGNDMSFQKKCLIRSQQAMLLLLSFTMKACIALLATVYMWSCSLPPSFQTKATENDEYPRQKCLYHQLSFHCSLTSYFTYFLWDAKADEDATDSSAKICIRSEAFD